MAQESSKGGRAEHDRRQAEVFDRVSDAFEEPIPEDIMGRLETIVASAGIKEGDAVLDVGTGTGVLIPLILKFKPSRVVGCDLSAEMLGRARSKFGDKVSFVQRDIVDLRHEAGQFNIVFCNAMFGNVYDQQEAVATISSLMADGGRLVISHPMGKGFLKELSLKSTAFRIKELPNRVRLESLLEPQGLTLIDFTDDPNLYIGIAEKRRGMDGYHHTDGADDRGDQTHCSQGAGES